MEVLVGGNVIKIVPNHLSLNKNKKSFLRHVARLAIADGLKCLESTVNKSNFEFKINKGNLTRNIQVSKVMRTKDFFYFLGHEEV